MVSRDKNKIVREIDKLNEIETLAVADFLTNLLSSRTVKSNKNPINDELILSLADAKENKRARQVVEWERVRRNNTHRIF